MDLSFIVFLVPLACTVCFTEGKFMVTRWLRSDKTPTDAGLTHIPEMDGENIYGKDQFLMV